MKAFTLLQAAGVVVASLLGMQAAQAQYSPQPLGTAYFNGSHLIGNQSDRFYINGSALGVEGPYIQLNPNNDNQNYPTQQGTIGLIAGYSSSLSNIAHSLVLRQYENNNLAWISYLRMLQSGQVQIGKQVPQTQTDYALAVDGKVVAKSVYVTTPANWADFVFAPTYKPMPLPELENYLQRNRHLPALPAASEVEAKGYSVTEMDAKLLQTIEELTLHVLALSKEVQALKAGQAAAATK